MTFEEGRMLVRETTHEASTLSIDHGMVGRRLPMLRTAAGRCYLALCPDKERRAILEMLSRSKAPEDRGARETQRLMKLSGNDPREGLCDPGSRDQSEDDGHRRAHSPRWRACSEACPSIWISSALTIEQAEIELLPLLTSTAGRIAEAVARPTRCNGSPPAGTANAQCTRICGSQRTMPGNRIRIISTAKSATRNGTTPR